MSDSNNKRSPEREMHGSPNWAASQATRLSGEGPLPGREALAEARRGVLCVKCERLSDTHLEKCQHCQSHLYIFCQRCGEKNARVHSRCEKCKRRLHRSVKDRVKGTDSNPINLLYIGLGLVGILLLIVVLIKVSGLRLW
jgi:hypothetical protein